MTANIAATVISSSSCELLKSSRDIVHEGGDAFAEQGVVDAYQGMTHSRVVYPPLEGTKDIAQLDTASGGY